MWLHLYVYGWLSASLSKVLMWNFCCRLITAEPETQIQYLAFIPPQAYISITNRVSVVCVYSSDRLQQKAARLRHWILRSGWELSSETRWLWNTAAHFTALPPSPCCIGFACLSLRIDAQEDHKCAHSVPRCWLSGASNGLEPELDNLGRTQPGCHLNPQTPGRHRHTDDGILGWDRGWIPSLSLPGHNFQTNILKLCSGLGQLQKKIFASLSEKYKK